MPVIIVVGVQWGDEGKGKIVDYLTERANLVVRFQGGHNAGHTLVVEGRKTALQLIPSGILRPGTRCLLASGVVVDPRVLLDEIEKLAAIGVTVSPERLGIAGEVQLIFPYHQSIDRERERALSDAKIGTTGKGIGPAYEDAVSRFGIRLADLFHDEYLKSLITRNVALKNNQLEAVLMSSERHNAQTLFDNLVELRDRLRPFVTNVSLEVDRARSAGEFIVFEGAQGALLDINHGTYPFVTSSNTVAGYACVSAGFGPRAVDMVLGICKAYATRVGSGPFPSEDHGADGEALRTVGGEFGTVTGRPRRCGWFDVMAVKRTVRLNGIDFLILTKLDVLSGFERIKIAYNYRVHGASVDDMPMTVAEMNDLEVDCIEVPGWDEDLSAVRSFDDLPKNAQAYIRKIEELVGCPVGGFSIGPDRAQTILVHEQVRALTLGKLGASSASAESSARDKRSNQRG